MNNWLIFVPAVAPVVAYWLSTMAAASRLPRQRRMVGDDRPVPDLLDPATSHHWFGIILTENTKAYSRTARRLFLVARTSLALIPLGVMLTVGLASRDAEATWSSDRGGTPSAALSLNEYRPSVSRL